MRILRLLLDDTSVNLSSPFYEHEVMLEQHPTTGHYTLKQWLTARCRIQMSEDRTESAFGANIRTILRQSFFPLMLPPTEVQDWQREYHQWDQYRRTGLAQRYHDNFDLGRWLSIATPPKPLELAEEESTEVMDDDEDEDDSARNTKDRVTLVQKKVKRGGGGTTEYTVKDYWAKFGAFFKLELDAFVKALSIKTQDLVPGSMECLYGLLSNNFRLGYITGYMRTRLLEMQVMVILHSQPEQKGVRTANLSLGVVRDLLLFYNEIQSLNLAEPDREYSLRDYINFGGLVDTLCNAGKLHSTLAFLVGDAEPLTKAEADESVVEEEQPDNDIIEAITAKKRHKRHEILRRVWVRKTLLDLRRRAGESLSTYSPIDVGTVIYYYNRMFGLTGDVKDRTLFLELDTDENGWDDKNAQVTSFTNNHYIEVLRLFIDTVLQQQQQQDGDKMTVLYNQGQKLTNYTPLFIIENKRDDNAIEEQSRVLFCEKLVKYVTVSGAQSWSTKTWQEETLSMDEIDEQLYQTRFVLLTLAPHEIRQSADLAIVRDLMAWNVYQVTLVRPNGSDHSLMRASLFFANEEDCGESGLTLPDFHKRFMELRRMLLCGDSRGKKSIMLVMDAHLLSINDMHLLLQWIHKKQVIRHVIMMGAPDALPLHTTGQAFCDLINWSDWSYLAAHMFEKEVFHQQLLKLIYQHDTTLHICNQYRQLEQCLKGQMKTRRKAVNLYHIMRYAKETSELEEHIDKSFRVSNNITVRPIQLSQLPFLCLTRGYTSEWFFFIVTQAQLKRMDRNQLNHLFMMVPNLTVVLTEQGYNAAKTKPLKLLRKTVQPQAYPNTRYTLPYVNHWQSALKPKQV
jgi:hypothetical protein